MLMEYRPAPTAVVGGKKNVPGMKMLCILEIKNVNCKYQ